MKSKTKKDLSVSGKSTPFFGLSLAFIATFVVVVTFQAFWFFGTLDIIHKQRKLLDEHAQLQYVNGIVVILGTAESFLGRHLLTDDPVVFEMFESHLEQVPPRIELLSSLEPDQDFQVFKRRVEAKLQSLQQIASTAIGTEGRRAALTLISNQDGSDLMHQVVAAAEAINQKQFQAAQDHLTTSERGTLHHLFLPGIMLVVDGILVGMIFLLLGKYLQQRRLIEESLSRQSLLFENLHDAVIMTDLDGTIVDLNPAAVRMFGMNRKDVVGQEVGLLSDEAASGTSTASSHSRIEQMLQNQRWVGDLEFLDTSGQPRVAETNIVPLRTDATQGGLEGAIVGAVWVCRDMTEQRSFQRDIQRLALVAQKTANGVIIISPQAQVEWANAGFTRLTGVPTHEVVDRKATEVLLTPETPIETILKLGDAFVGGRPYSGEIFYRNANGMDRWLSLTVTPVHGDDGVLLSFVAIFSDVSEIKQIELELESARDAALESARLKSEFLANMSHEIRTPMNGVIGMAGLLLDTPLAKEQREFAQIIRTSADSLLGILNDILDFSKIDAGKLEFESSPFSALRVLEQSLDLMSERAFSKQIELGGFLEPDVPRQLLGDAGRLRQVMLNLLSNAIKFTENGEVTLHGTVHTWDGPNVVLRFSIRDTGIGVPASARPHLFEAFRQVDNSTTRKYGGTGLGLAICRQLVERFEGEIGFDSVEGQGSHFWFTASFPIVTEENSAPPSLPSVAGIRALILDENDTSRDILVRQLASFGIESRDSSDPQEALEYLASESTPKAADNSLRLFFIDRSIARTDGLLIAEFLKTAGSVGKIYPVLLTKIGDLHDPTSPLHIPFAATLTKPIKQTDLDRCVRDIVDSPPEIPNSPPDTNDNVDNAPTEPASEDSQTSSSSILLVEDNPVNRKVALKQLSKLGWHADAVENGKEAVDAVQNHSYRLILMDCQMPVMDGFTATGEIRKWELETGKKVAIVAMTANALAGDRERCLASGMDDYISKPVSLDQLKRVIETWGTHPF